MLEARNLSFQYGLAKEKGRKDFRIRDVSIKVEPGYVSCLLGKNGAGKSTLLSLLYGMRKPGSGEIFWNGEKLTAKNLALFRREAGYAGEKWCMDGMTLEKNVEMLSILYPDFDDQYFEELLRMAGLEDVREKLFATFSTGERVKAELAFLMARRPKLLLLDEPLANIDPVFKTDILELLLKAVKENETGILISTHLVDEISDLVDYVYVMENGSMKKSGDRFEVLKDGNLREALLGE